MRCKAQTKLYNSLVKHSPDRHIFTIIEECSIEDLKCKERYWQDFYNVLSKKWAELKTYKVWGTKNDSFRRDTYENK